MFTELQERIRQLEIQHAQAQKAAFYDADLYVKLREEGHPLAEQYYHKLRKSLESADAVWRELRTADKELEAAEAMELR